MVPDYASWNHGHQVALVASKDRTVQGRRLAEKSLERCAIEERPLRVPYDPAGRRQQMLQSLAGSSCDEQDAKRLVAAVAVQIVQSQFPLQALDILLRLNAFGAIVQLDEELERLAVAAKKLECRIGVEGLALNVEPQGLVGVVVGELAPGTPGSHVGVNHEVGKKARVRLRSMRNDCEEGPRRQRGISVKQAEAGASQLVVQNRSLAGRGVGPRTHPAGVAKGLEPLAEISLAGKGHGEALADLEQLLFVVGPAGQDGEQFLITIGQQDVSGASWHAWLRRVAWHRPVRFQFHLHAREKSRLCEKRR